MKKTTLLLSCEHASREIPKKWATIFQDKPVQPDYLHYDLHAKELTERLAKTFGCDYLLGNVSRQLVDLNKTDHQEHCLGDTVRALSEPEKEKILKDYFYQYRHQFETFIDNILTKNQQVLHVSVHSFNPNRPGFENNAALGLLYDPNRHGEKEVVRIWHELLVQKTAYKVRLNYPRVVRGGTYLSCLRKKLNEFDYLGIQLECNDVLLANQESAKVLEDALIETLTTLIEVL